MRVAEASASPSFGWNFTDVLGSIARAGDQSAQPKSNGKIQWRRGSLGSLAPRTIRASLPPQTGRESRGGVRSPAPRLNRSGSIKPQRGYGVRTKAAAVAQRLDVILSRCFPAVRRGIALYNENATEFNDPIPPRTSSLIPQPLRGRSSGRLSSLMRRMAAQTLLNIADVRHASRDRSAITVTGVPG